MNTPTSTQSEPAMTHEPGSAPETTRATLNTRTSPIVWGCLTLALCAYVLQRTLAPETVNAAYWITGVLFGIGALLLGVGVAIVARNQRNQRSERSNLGAGFKP